MRNTSALQTIKAAFLLCAIAAFIHSCSGLNPSFIQSNNKLNPQNQDFGRMWTFDHPPLSYLEKTYGFLPDQQWLNALQLGSLRIGGEDILSVSGSASFVYGNDMARAISVHVDGIMETLIKVYEVDMLVREPSGE